MSRYALNERGNGTQVNVIPAFEDGYHSAVCKLISTELKLLSEPFIVKFVDTGVVYSVDEVLFVGIETR